MFEFQRVQSQLAAQIRQPHAIDGLDIAAPRLKVYQDLFFNNINGFISRMFPVLKLITPTDRWLPMVRDFMLRHRCHSPYFLDIAKEFLQYLEQERENSLDPAFMLELCHYEWVEIALDTQQFDWDSVEVNAQGDMLTGRPVLSPLAWPLQYQYPVHQISLDYQPEQAPEQATYLVANRNRADQVKFTNINAITLRLLTLIQQFPDYTGKQSLELIAQELQHPQPDVVVQGGLDILHTLRDGEILLGIGK